MRETMEIKIEKAPWIDTLISVGCVIAVILFCAQFVPGIMTSVVGKCFCLLVIFASWIYFEFISGLGKSPTEMLRVQFQDEQVIISRGKKKRRIAYQDILEVEKIMVIRDRTTPEKGFYRVRVKMRRGMSYRFFTPMEDYDKHLDFEETQLYDFYHAFGQYGVKCC